MNVPFSRLPRLLRGAIGAAVLSLGAGAVHAEDLLQIFELAIENDPEVRQARATYNAEHTRIDQGRALLLPSVTATARTSRDTNGIDGELPPDDNAIFPRPSHSFANGYNTKGYGLSVSQAVLNFEAWYAFKSAQKTDQVAALTLAQAEQQLIMRVAEAYFNVLRSQANLESFRAEVEASQQVLDQTQQRFDVGLVPITDVYDSETNADLAQVNLLVEENNLAQSLEALEAITGMPYSNVSELNDNFPITTANTSLEEWTALAMEQNLALQAAETDLEAKKEDARSARAAMYPTVDLDMSYGWNQSGNQISITPGIATENSAITLNFTMPLFAGGGNRSRMRQAYFLRDASEEALLKTRRDSVQAIRNAYRSVETNVRAVAARAQAIMSAESALEATEIGVDVGTRNVVDVVLAQRTLFQAQRDHANARFDYVMDTLLLRQAAGTLNPQDIIDLNQWLSD